MNPTVLAIPAIVCYFAGGLATGLRLFRSGEDYRPPRQLGIGLGLLAVLLHGMLLYGDLVSPAGVNLGFFNALSLAFWLVAALLMVSALGKPVENLGILLLPLAAASIVLSLRFPSVRLLDAAAPLGLRLHVLVSLLAYSLLALAALQSVLLAVQDRHLRRHKPGGFVRALPPLQTMEFLLFEMIAIGFVLLSLSLLSGFAFLENMFAQQLAHKTLLSILAWIAFGLLLWGRFRHGWRGTRAIRWTLAAFAILVLAYFGSKFVLELILAR